MSKNNKEVKKNKFAIKVLKINKSIKIYIVICFLIILSIGGVTFYKFQFVKKINKEKRSETNNINKIKNIISQVKDQIKKADEYKQLWKLKHPNKKSFDGLESDKVTAFFEKIADKYYLDEYSINLSRPNKITEKAYINKSFDSYFLNCEISFKAASDTYAFNFIYDFVKSSTGLLLIESIEITKSKSYEARDLISISKGEFGVFTTAVKMKIKWIFFKKKKN
jgi:hypothetical protein